MDLLSTLFDVGFFAAMIRIATPLILATLGELYSERSGVLNLGIEGIMLFGAMVGFTAAYFTGSLWLGVLAALVDRRARRTADGVPDRRARRQPARLRHRHDAARDRASPSSSTV